jgi:general secretion pathway protein I
VRARGFTLVEVMVALAIVAIALPALLMSLYQQIDDTAYLRDKTLAYMVAENKLAEIRLVISSTRNLSAGKDSGLSSMAGRDWYWWVETKTTEVAKFFRVDIAVALDEQQQEQPLYTLTAFMSGDLEAGDAETGAEGNLPDERDG